LLVPGKPRTRNGQDNLTEYVAGLTLEETARKLGIPAGELIKLNSNENSLGPSPKAVEAIQRCAGEISLYPAPDAAELRGELARHRNVPYDNIVVGAGMDGVLETTYRVFLDSKDEVLIPLPTFSYYEVAALFFGATPRFIKRDSSFNVHTDQVIEACGPKTRMVMLTSPNNPSGNLVNKDAVLEIAENVDSMVFLDAAYGEFSDQCFDELPVKLDNVMVGHTLSKAYGLAGLRVGYAITPEWFTAEYLKVATPFAVNRVAIAAAMASINDEEHLRKSIELVRRGREYLYSNLKFKVFPSQANFVAVNTSPLKSKDVCDRLLARGVLVRDCTSFRGAGEYLVRVTVGTEEQNMRLVKELNRLQPVP
jgi:histidinol-phosphate aminotransferase